MDCSLPGSSVHGIFQARVLEWAAIAFSGICARWLYIKMGDFGWIWLWSIQRAICWLFPFISMKCESSLVEFCPLGSLAGKFVSYHLISQNNSLLNTKHFPLCLYWNLCFFKKHKWHIQGQVTKRNKPQTTYAMKPGISAPFTVSKTVSTM